jgi:cell wall assembly regulator SMI1
MNRSWPPMARRGPTITIDSVRRFEQQLGAVLPDDYRAFLLEINGGRTARSNRVFVIHRAGHRDETSLNTLFSLDDPDESRDLAIVQQQRLDPLVKLPQGVLEIGCDGFGSAIVLPLVGERRGEVWYSDTVDARPTGSNPRVEWFDRRDVWRIAGSFAEFMAGLRPLEAAS